MGMRLIHLLILAFSLHLRSVSAETQNRVFVADTNLEGTGSIYSATTENLNFTQIPIDGNFNPFSVTFDPIEDKVYWSDATFFRHIARASTDGSNFEIVVADVRSEGLAIDKLTRSLFWGDPDLDRIVRTSLDGSTQETAILENVRSPGGIVIDELASQIYWISFANPARIERANTSGSGRFILVDEDLGVPQGLTVDFQEKRIYWADVSRNSIETSDLLGNNRRVVLQEDPLIVNFVPVGITVDREYVYITSWQLRHIVRLDKYGLQPPELVGNVQLRQAGGLYSEQANVIDPTCEKDCQNGAQCRQLAAGSECICQPGYLGENCEIQSNDLSCTADPCLQGGRCVQERDYYTCVCRGGYYGVNCEITPFLLVANRGVGQIYSAPVTNLNNITSLPLPIAPPEIPSPEPTPSPELEPWAVSFDPSEFILYWTNGWDGTIHRTDSIIDESIVSVGAIPYGLALNLEARTLYWTQDSKVTMANIGGSSQRIVIQEGLQQPRDIEVDAAGEHIYWTDVGTGSIERANLDGSNRVVLVDNLGEPYGITIDYQGDVLYWGDALLNQIWMLDLTTGVRSLVVEISSPDIHPFDLITFGNLVIWTDWSLPNLIQVEKSGTNAGLASDAYYDQASGIHLVEGNDNSCASEPCINQGRCRQLTLGFQCVCIEGFMGSTCETATDDSCSSSPCLNGTCKQFPQGYSCECHQGYSGRLCETDDIMFVVDQLTAVIYNASLVNIEDTFAVLPLENLGQPAGVTVDNLEGILYWTDIINGTISRSYLDGSGQEIFLEGLQQPSGLAINPVTRAIFWTSNNNTHIETYFLDDAYRQTILENLDQIRDIALDSYQSWSFGIVMYKVYSYGKLPYNRKWNNHQILVELESGYRLEKPPACPDYMYEFMLKCWHKFSNSRPTFTTLVKELDRKLTEVNARVDDNTGYITAIQDTDAPPGTYNPDYEVTEDTEQGVDVVNPIAEHKVTGITDDSGDEISEPQTVSGVPDDGLWIALHSLKPTDNVTFTPDSDQNKQVVQSQNSEVVDMTDFYEFKRFADDNNRNLPEKEVTL